MSGQPVLRWRRDGENFAFIVNNKAVNNRLHESAVKQEFALDVILTDRCSSPILKQYRFIVGAEKIVFRIQEQVHYSSVNRRLPWVPPQRLACLYL